MSDEKLVLVGQIGAAHGIKGAFKLFSYTSPFENIFAYGPFFDEKGVLLCDKLHPVGHASSLIATLITHNKQEMTREEIARLKGLRLFVPRGQLSDKLDEDEFYITDLIGLSVINQEGEALGIVVAVDDFGAGDLLEVNGPEGRFYVPFTRARVPEIVMGECVRIDSEGL